MTLTATERYRAARDELLAARTDPDRAAAFTWPRFEGSFNWAIDWFDPMARGNHAPALIVVDDDGTHHQRTFDELARRSDQVAAWLASRGVRRGDAVLLMLGNQVELWEAMLGIMKLGGVIAPTTTALGAGDLADRIERAEIRHVIVGASDAEKFDDLPEGLGRIVVGGQHAGWAAYDDAFLAEADPARHPETLADDRLLLYFTSGTTSKPKLVEHTHASYPVGHLSTMYWLGLQPGDVHLAISSPGWAKHAWSLFFAPWIAGATVLALNYSRFSAERLLDELERDRVTTFCAPPTVWRMLIQADLAGRRGALREVVSAGEPLNPEVIATVQRAWGLDIRDGYGQTEMTAVVANNPGSPARAGVDGTPAARVPRRADRSGDRRAGRRGRDLPRPVGAAAQPHDRLRRRPGTQRRVHRERSVPHGRRGAPRRPRHDHLHRSHRRRVQVLGLQDQPVRARERAHRAPRRGRGGRRSRPGRPAAVRAQGLRRARRGIRGR
ncbi:AMP-binding protein [Microbacterium sp. SORGH_AS_0969]|uniref:AMP-binding protein n=1 Tax=Microbacterium sp. SORGH_AS_0969 TaxID=3041793 RepID=UPI00358F77F6